MVSINKKNTSSMTAVNSNVHKSGENVMDDLIKTEKIERNSCTISSTDSETSCIVKFINQTSHQDADNANEQRTER